MNAGIYLTLIEHVVASLLVGILAVATPSSESFGLRSQCFYMLIILFKLSGHLLPHLHPGSWLPSVLLLPLFSFSALLVLLG